MMRQVPRIGLALGLAAALPLLGCYGSFGLVRKIYKFNGEVSQDKWAREGVFLLLNFAPVYSGAAFLDSIFFNAVEFWTGETLISDGKPAHGPPTDSTDTTNTTDGGGSTVDRPVDTSQPPAKPSAPRQRPKKKR
jgi:hypothetical protein